ncbi:MULTISPECIES: helix-turn-helix transcriptional regulator [Saliphagus]|uniref:Helix-turn-helix transcriptional regulator n=1 Tax=Saliphagus infecundisoli TaxID=1849069 RepID=A0ABD5Q999_9EURY|nr:MULTISPECIES: winged helix-turn-helix transcriptional regulator [Saliphagus]
MLELTQELKDSPPSSKLVYIALKDKGELTQNELTDETRLSKRTVRDALQRLESRGLVEEDIYIRDARQNLYLIPESDRNTCEPDRAGSGDATRSESH